MHPLNIQLYSVVILSGSVTEESAVQPENTYDPIVVKESGSVTLVRDLQL